MNGGAGAVPPTDVRDGRAGGGAEWEARGDSAVPHTGVHRMARRTLEMSQDLLVVGLAFALLALMVRTLIAIAQHAVAPQVPPRNVLGEVLFMLVLIELLRLLVTYLRDHHLSVDAMVEATIVAALREVALIGVTEIPSGQLVVISAFVLALGLLLRFGDLRISQRTRARGTPRRPWGVRSATRPTGAGR